MNHAVTQKGMGSAKSEKLHATDAVLLAYKWCNFIHLAPDKVMSIFYRKNISLIYI